jgi:hypothetical protein
VKAPPASRSELDEVIVNIELTLASIAVATPLCRRAANVA